MVSQFSLRRALHGTTASYKPAKSRARSKICSFSLSVTYGSSLAAMGFINSCWEAFVQIATYAQSIGTNYDANQQPLHLPSHDHTSGIPGVDVSAGVSFPVVGANFTCQYPSMTGYKPCNTANDRTCWLKGPKGKRDYTITSDYENFGPKGVVREYWLDVDLQAIAPDGYVKALGQVFNGSYPGPHLQACWGDQMVVHVTNKIPNLGTTVHWHGIRQLHTNQQDGVNGM